MRRWDYVKRAFVLPPGEITISLLDVALILRLQVTGDDVVIRPDTPFLNLEEDYNVHLWNRKITVVSLEKRLDGLAETNNEYFVRTFLLFMFGTFLIPNATASVDSRYLYFLQDLDKVNKFAWGAVVLKDIFHWLHKKKKEKVQYVGGCLIFLQIWCLGHIGIAHSSFIDGCAKFPRICNWKGIRSHRKRWSTKFKELSADQIIWSLELTFDESNTDIIKELIEAEKRKTWADMKERSLADTSSHIINQQDHSEKTGYQLTVGMEIESESESSRVNMECKIFLLNLVRVKLYQDLLHGAMSGKKKNLEGILGQMLL